MSKINHLTTKNIKTANKQSKNALILPKVQINFK